MSRSTTTVEGPVIFGDGSPIKKGKMNFELTTYDVETGEAFYVSGPFSVDISDTGDFTIDLFDNSKGENNTSYRVYADYVSSTDKIKTEEFGHLFLTGPGPYKFADLSFAPDWVPTNQDLMSQLQGYASAANQAGVYAAQAQQTLTDVQAIGLYADSLLFYVSDDATSVTVALTEKASFTDPGPGPYATITIEVP